MKNSSKIKITLVCLALVLCYQSLFAVSVDNNLAALHQLYVKKNYKLLLNKLSIMKCSIELQSLKQYLEAEALKGLGNDETAILKYSALLHEFPETEVAFRSRFTHFILSMKVGGASQTEELKALAMSLPTVWQRSAALRKMASLVGLSARQQSKLLLRSIREAYSEKAFYSKSEIVSDICALILRKPTSYIFTEREWVEILRYAAREEQFPLIEGARGIVSRLIGTWGNDYFLIFKARKLSMQKKIQKSLIILDKMLSKQLSHKHLISCIYQAKGNLLYSLQRYDEAIYCYRQVLAKPYFPVNRRAAEYRLMRSFNGANKDAEAIEMVDQLIKSKMCEPLLPIQLYSMGLERYDAGNKTSAILYFMKLVQRFPEHYRADDALGYSIFAWGKSTGKGKVLFEVLKRKYPNSFFVWWIDPSYKSVKLPSDNSKSYKISNAYKMNVRAWQKLWNSPFADIAREEVRKLTDKYPKDLSFYKAAIDIATKSNDYNRLTAYGERIFRQLILAGKNGSNMPSWAWKSFYPRAFWNVVKKQGQKHSISPYWILSIMREESHFNVKTLSRSNAMSLMQILPSTGKWIAKKLGVKRFRKKMLWNPDANIKFGSWYLRFLSDMFEGDLFLASASYNGGQGNIKRKVQEGPYKELPVIERLDRVPMSETRDYFKKVLGSFWNYLRIYN